MREEVYLHEDAAFNLRISRDGMLMLQVRSLTPVVRGESVPPEPIQDTAAWWGKYLDHVNTLHLLLDSAVLSKLNLALLSLTEVTWRDALIIRFEDGYLKGGPFLPDSSAESHQLLRYASYCFRGDPSNDSRIFSRRILPIEVFDLLKDNFAAAIRHPFLIQSLASVARSLSQYKVGNYSTSLLLSWFVIEAVINQEWDRFIDSSNRDLENGVKRINAERRKHLSSGPDYPISVVSNLLELADVLPSSDFMRIDQVRRYRNNIVHSKAGFVCGSEHCKMAIQLALDLCTKDSFKIQPNFFYSLIGTR
jgi:hypothetical protein